MLMKLVKLFAIAMSPTKTKRQSNIKLGRSICKTILGQSMNRVNMWNYKLRASGVYLSAH